MYVWGKKTLGGLTPNFLLVVVRVSDNYYDSTLLSTTTMAMTQ